MKIIATDLITSISALNENANYPVANLQDGFLTTLFKSDRNHTVLTINISAGSNGFMLFNCNAESISISAIVPGDGEWDSADADGFESGDSFFQQESISITEYNGLDGSNYGAYVCYWATQTTSIQLTITLSNTTSILQAGIALAGAALQYDYAALLNTNESFNDLSIRQKLNNGSINVIDDELQRVVSLPYNFSRSVLFRSFINNVLRVIKSNPAGFHLLNTGGAEWLIYGRLNNKTGGTHNGKQRTSGKITITEAL